MNDWALQQLRICHANLSAAIIPALAMLPEQERASILREMENDRKRMEIELELKLHPPVSWPRNGE